MPGEIRLETPTSPDSLYLAREADLTEELLHRPAFTGDVLRLTDGKLGALVQHPCAMRRGVELAKRLLVCGLREWPSPPPDWSTGHFKRAFMPRLNENSYAIEFDDLDVIDRDDVAAATRVAVLSQSGVNLLVQRWIHHNSRVVIPTVTIDEQTSGPFEEADLLGEACSDLVNAGKDPHEALQMADAWLSGSQVDGGVSRRQLLGSAQERSTVRISMRRWLREIS